MYDVNKKRFEECKCETETERCIYFHPPNIDIVGRCSSEDEVCCGCCREMKKKDVIE